MCGPIYTIADIFTGPAVRRARDAHPPPGPGLRRVHRPRHRSKLSRPPPRSAGRPPGRRARTTTRSTASCSASPETDAPPYARRACCDPDHRLRRRPRDGLQNDPTYLCPATRSELVNRLVDAGLRHVEVASFVNPKRVPADGRRRGGRSRRSDRRPGSSTAGLVLNERGYDRLARAALDEVHMAVAASQSLNQSNQNATIEESAGRRRADHRARPRRGRRVQSWSPPLRVPVRGRRGPRAGPRRRRAGA